MEMDWKEYLTPKEQDRLKEIDQARKDLNAEYRRIYDRCRKRHRRSLDAVEMTTPSGHAFLIDKECFEIVAPHRWYSVCHTLKDGRRRTPYIQGIVEGRRVYLHRFLMGEPSGLVIDHIDGDPLNNCKSNLRCVTQKQNARSARIDPAIEFNASIFNRAV